MLLNCKHDYNFYVVNVWFSYKIKLYDTINYYDVQVIFNFNFKDKQKMEHGVQKNDKLKKPLTSNLKISQYHGRNKQKTSVNCYIKIMNEVLKHFISI